MYKGIPVLDVHSHLRALRPTSVFLTQLLGRNAPIDSPIAPGAALPFGHFNEGMRDEDFREAADRHATYIDERNIDVQILGPHPIDVHGWMAPKLFASWTSYVNDMIFKICQAKPDRWIGACQLPQNPAEPDTQHVLPELDRCIDDYGFVATYVSPDITGNRDSPAMGEPYWYPLYERCEERGIPIIVHGTNSADARLQSIPHSFHMGFLTEQFYATQFLRTSDVFDRFPALKVLVCHCGGALDRFIKESPFVGRPGRDLSQNLFFDTCSYDLDFLAAAIKQRGVSQMCFGVEAPGSGAMTIRPETGTSSDDMVPLIGSSPTLSFLSDEDKTSIFRDNPVAFCPGLADPLATNARAKLRGYPEAVA